MRDSPRVVTPAKAGVQVGEGSGKATIQTQVPLVPTIFILLRGPRKAKVIPAKSLPRTHLRRAGIQRGGAQRGPALRRAPCSFVLGILGGWGQAPALQR